MIPFTDNIIFFDAEFTSLDPHTGEILSLALVKIHGDSLTLELDIPEGTPIDPWVTDNVLPHLSGKRVSREDACARVNDFVGTSKPHLVSYVYPFDAVFLHKLFGLNKWPFHRFPLDLASMLCAAGYDPEKLFDADKALSHLLQEPETTHHTLHNALNDTLLVRDVYLKLFKSTAVPRVSDATAD